MYIIIYCKHNLLKQKNKPIFFSSMEINKIFDTQAVNIVYFLGLWLFLTVL